MEPGRIDRVVLRASTCFHGHQARPLELGKVARHGRLGDAEAPHDLLGVELTLEQQIEHPQASWICECAGRLEQIHLTADG